MWQEIDSKKSLDWKESGGEKSQIGIIFKDSDSTANAYLIFIFYIRII